MPKSLQKTFTKGLLRENPILRLGLGVCPTLAVTTLAINGLGMGIIVIFVLLCSNIVISMLRKIIPDQVRIPAYITIIAGFVTIVKLLVEAFIPELNDSLGIFLPLLVVNCILLGRAESFAGKNRILPSALDGLGMGIGYTAALTLIAMIRELAGNGTLFGMTVTAGFIEPMAIFILPPGGFFVFGIIIALSKKFSGQKYTGVSPYDSCKDCTSAEFCSYCNMKGGV